jgi:hypothetical protein
VIHELSGLDIVDSAGDTPGRTWSKNRNLMIIRG